MLAEGWLRREHSGVVFDRLFGKGRATVAARKAELRGELARAAELFGEADQPAEAARVMLLRGDAETDPRARLAHYTQAAAVAPEGAEIRRIARRKRAQLVLRLSPDPTTSAAQRHLLLEAARELEAVGEVDDAARAYARAGDAESEARAIAQAGDVDRLEQLLGAQRENERAARRRHALAQDVEMLIASGRRREALVAAEAFDRTAGDEGALRREIETLHARRAAGPIARVLLHGRPLGFVLGAEVVLGRGAFGIASPAVSRRHLRIARSAAGIAVYDLGGRNGTTYRGLALAGELPVGAALDLRLGGEVPVRVAPGLGPWGGVDIEVAGASYAAPLGPLPLGIGAWRMEQAADGWLELVTDDQPPAVLEGIHLVPRVTLLVGDAFATERGAEPVLRILA